MIHGGNRSSTVESDTDRSVRADGNHHAINFRPGAAASLPPKRANDTQPY